MAVDDYYALFGVSPDSPADEIRAAYREKRDDLAAKGTEEARAEASRLNRAWNVLSDPYQRGRYDEQLARSREEGDGGAEEEEEEETSETPARPARRRLFEPAPRGERARRPAPQPTIEYPAGTTPAPTRQRVVAMVIDLAVLVVVFVGLVMFAGAQLVESRHGDELDRLDVISEELDAAEEERDSLEDEADKAEEAADAAEEENADDAEDLRAEADSAREKADAADEQVDALTEDARDVQSELVPIQLGILEAAFLVGLLYLVVPSALTGQTLGKRLRRIRVVRRDGSPPGWRGALVRYGVIVVGTNLVYVLLRELAIAVALFVVMGWMRNPDQQGLHDRAAKTLVVGTTE